MLMQKITKISFGLCLITIFIFNTVIPHFASAAESNIRIAVVPKFKNLSKSEELNKWVESIPAMLHKGLINSPKITVVERESLTKVMEEISITQKIDIFDLKTIAEIGKGVGANFVVTGSFVEDKGKIRIDVRLVDVEKITSIVAESHTCGKDDI